MTSLNTRCDFFEIALLSSFFWLIARHSRIPAAESSFSLAPYKTHHTAGCCSGSTASNEGFVTKFANSILLVTFLAADEFETIKYRQM